MSPFLPPDLAAIERALDVLLQKEVGARVLAMRSPVCSGWPESIERAGRRFVIAWCPSELDVRERLDEAESGGDGIIVVTPIDQAYLSNDVLARFPKARLEQSDRWSLLRAAFQAHDLDPRMRLPQNLWLVDLLLERIPIGGYPPSAGGVLDLESAWRAALETILLLPSGRTDTYALLEWTLERSNLQQLSRLPDEARAAIAERMTNDSGAGASLVLKVVAAGRGSDVLPAALACGVVFAEKPQRASLRDAAIRLEPLLGGTRPELATVHELAEAGRRVYGRLIRERPDLADAAKIRAEAVLREIRAQDAVVLSPTLEAGLEARIAEAAAAVRRTVETGMPDEADQAWSLVQCVLSHDRAQDYRDRIERLRMAARLGNWLTIQDRPVDDDMKQATVSYATDGSFVDRARHAIRAGDPSPAVAEAYARLAEAVSARRDEQNRSFAELLGNWTAQGGGGSDPIPIEQVLERVVGPLARDVPLLLLVLDGLSLAVWHDLAATVNRLGWTMMVPENRRSQLIGAAVIPSITEVSRASLLSGTLRAGDQGVERSGFAGHRDLLSASRAGKPARLFHKADLGSGPDLGSNVREILANPEVRIVGVVHNAIDAQLSGSDQINLTWTAEGLRQVAAVLQTARDAGRAVIVVGDHGHVLDEGTTQLSKGSGDRWRSDDLAPRDGEIALQGQRVLSPTGGNKVIVAWSERVRYSAKRSGYHGGASPQEVLVPVAVLAAGQALKGWIEAPPSEPSWWWGKSDGRVVAAGGFLASPPAPKTRRQPEARQAELFVSEPVQAPSPPRSRIDWLDALMTSEPYAAQRRLAGRAAPADEKLRQLIEVLTSRSGRISRIGLARELGLAAFRVGGMLSAARRVLNLDQAQVLREEDDDVVLDIDLLRRQFAVGGNQ